MPENAAPEVFAEQHDISNDEAVVEDVSQDVLVEEVSIDGMCGVY